jgi:zinc transport system substrate-binding protein
MRLRTVLVLAGAGVAAAAVGLVLAFSGGSGKRSGPVRKIVAAFYPLAYAAEQTAGPGVRVFNLTPAGSEPHDLELTPAAVRTIHSADLILLMGHGFQPQVESAARQSGAKVLLLLDTPGISRRGEDPHVWLDPRRYSLLVREIGRAMGREGAAASMTASLEALDRDFRQGLADCARRDIVTTHEAFGYLARRYGLNQVAIEGLSPEAEPSPAQLERVARIVRERHVTTIYFETLISPKLAKTVARETGAKTAVLDPIEGLTPKATEAGADYFSVMRANLSNLRAGLGCS